MVSRRVLTAKNITEQKPITSGATGGNDLSAVLHHHIRFIDLLSDSHPLKSPNAAGQEGFSDLETGKLLLLEYGNTPALLGQQRSCGASCRSATGDNDIEKFSHGLFENCIRTPGQLTQQAEHCQLETESTRQ